jgi:hypothetical protein
LDAHVSRRTVDDEDVDKNRENINSQISWISIPTQLNAVATIAAKGGVRNGKRRTK